MADNTKIEWADATLNYVNGCSLESPGCTNCYAMKQAHRFPVRQGLTVKTKGGMVWTGEVRPNEKALHQALAWKRGRRIFWNAHGDLFHPSVPDEWIDRQFAVCALTPQHTHMILTKRSARMREYVTRWYERLQTESSFGLPGKTDDLLLKADLSNERAHVANIQAGYANIWLGVSVEDQQRVHERVPDLLATPAAVRFISAEPLLGPVDLQEWLICPSARDGLSMDPSTGAYECCRWCDWTGLIGGLDWVIVGGESGSGARPMHPDWVRSLRDQCAAAGVAFHFKQWGEWMPTAYREGTGEEFGNLFLDGSNRWATKFNGPWQSCEREKAWVDSFYRAGKREAGRLLDGRTHDDFPQVPT